MKEERIVIPGEEIATSEEYLAGEGTYELKGKIYSTFLGRLSLDNKEKVARVKPVTPLVELKVGDVVLAHVTDVRNSMAIADVLRVEGNERRVTGETMASIHVSKISAGYTEDVRKEYRIGDVIRAKVIQVSPSVQLATDNRNFGVLLALCTKCRMPLNIHNKNLFCENCQRTESRNMAPDYGRYNTVEVH